MITRNGNSCKLEFFEMSKQQNTQVQQCVPDHFKRQVSKYESLLKVKSEAMLPPKTTEYVNKNIFVNRKRYAETSLPTTSQISKQQTEQIQKYQNRAQEYIQKIHQQVAETTRVDVSRMTARKIKQQVLTSPEFQEHILKPQRALNLQLARDVVISERINLVSFIFNPESCSQQLSRFASSAHKSHQSQLIHAELRQTDIFNQMLLTRFKQFQKLAENKQEALKYIVQFAQSTNSGTVNLANYAFLNFMDFVDKNKPGTIEYSVDDGLIYAENTVIEVETGTVLMHGETAVNELAVQALDVQDITREQVTEEKTEITQTKETEKQPENSIKLELPLSKSNSQKSQPPLSDIMKNQEITKSKQKLETTRHMSCSFVSSSEDLHLFATDPIMKPISRPPEYAESQITLSMLDDKPESPRYNTVIKQFGGQLQPSKLSEQKLATVVEQPIHQNNGDKSSGFLLQMSKMIQSNQNILNNKEEQTRDVSITNMEILENDFNNQKMDTINTVAEHDDIETILNRVQPLENVDVDQDQLNRILNNM
ncbi:Hypothetical_protein [Hexamita inflata]|uniref:Hypothetical_protein n=1 Tax=Hexamita inflata TaxID=28002 RepID=A0AA86QE89_9EUKA|nr:Hypothetical protein HINF_LOCUS39157 [Hexamita inflata]